MRDLSIRYSSPARLGDHVRVSVRVGDRTRVRLEMLSSIQCVADGRVCATATVTLAPIDTATGKVRRAWPPALINALANAQPAA